MGKILDMTGIRFSRLTVIARAPRGVDTRAYWSCRCDCGNTAIVSGKNLRSGITRSCGCLSAEWAKSLGANPEFIAQRAASQVTHGQKRRGAASAEYKTWLAIKRRCYAERCKDYPNWGGRGIRVCEAWRKSFSQFLADMGHKPTHRHQIDRLDPAKDYSPENCRWVTPEVHASENRRNITPITVGNRAFGSLAAAGRHFGVAATTISRRVKVGVDPVTAVTVPAWKLPG
tara:strand:+ start:1187 stop:1876 length:690 start_codon:yes stop_codon:yes gene_type:complete